MTDDPNARRLFLVDKLIDFGLADNEYAELDRLQRGAGRMNSPAKEAIVETRILIGDARREALFALMSDVKESAILRGLLEKLGDIEAKVDDVEAALKSNEISWVRRGLE